MYLTKVHLFLMNLLIKYSNKGIKNKLINSLFISMNCVFKLIILITSSYSIGGLRHVKKFDI